MKCPNCGADLRYDPALQKNVCDYCGSTFDPEDLQEKKAKQPKAEESYFDTIMYSCPQCGANLYTTEETYVTFCSYCGSANTLEGKMVKRKKPEKIIPFALSKEDAEKAYRDKLRHALFAPGNMAKTEVIEKFRGIYMPYWNYDVDYKGNVTVKGTTSKQRGDYKYIRHYDLDMQLDLGYHGLGFDASSTFDDNLSGSIAPFDSKQAKAFEPAYINGFYADMPDVDETVYNGEAKDVVGRDTASKIRRLLPAKKYNVSEENCNKGSKFKVKGTMSMYPVWFLASKSKDGKRISYAAVNGQTGRVAAEMPMDFVKYLISSLILAIPIFLLLNLFFVLTPVKAMGTAMILNFIAALMVNHECDVTYTRRYKLADEGYRYTHKDDETYQKLLNETKAEKATENKTKGKKTKKKKPATPLEIVLTVIGALWWFIILIVILCACVSLEGTILTLLSKKGVLLLVIVMLSYLCGEYIKTDRKKVDGTGKKQVCHMPIQEKWRMLIKSLIGLMIAAIVFAINPNEDMIHYIAAVISMGLVVWNFYDLIKLHNALSSRPIPQMEKRGGDAQ